MPSSATQWRSSRFSRLLHLDVMVRCCSSSCTAFTTSPHLSLCLLFFPSSLSTSLLHLQAQAPDLCGLPLKQTSRDSKSQKSAAARTKSATRKDGSGEAGDSPVLHSLLRSPYLAEVDREGCVHHWRWCKRDLCCHKTTTDGRRCDLDRERGQTWWYVFMNGSPSEACLLLNYNVQVLSPPTPNQALDRHTITECRSSRTYQLSTTSSATSRFL